MKKVITYGSFDLFHFGHQRLLERAKALGDYLIVGVTSDDYDRTRGKINASQSIAERIASVKATGLADEIIIEEYDGQKIDDIKRYNVDIFTVGDDWKGQFDYLDKYCKVIYLERTKGISSTEIRSENRNTNLGIIGDSIPFFKRILNEAKFVNGINITSIYCEKSTSLKQEKNLELKSYVNFEDLLKNVDSIYIKSSYQTRYKYIKGALQAKKHVLYESPACLDSKEFEELTSLAKANNCILMEAIRTAYSTAYKRLSLLAEIGKIGEILSIDTTCTNMKRNDPEVFASMYEWGPNALLPIFQILGVDYKKREIISRTSKEQDIFSRINFIYPHATASATVAEGAKSEGELIITGTKAYIYVPAPWWKTEYFELRYEDQTKNKRYYYQLEGEGIRYELVEFLQAIKDEKDNPRIEKQVSAEICKVMNAFKNREDLVEI